MRQPSASSPSSSSQRHSWRVTCPLGGPSAWIRWWRCGTNNPKMARMKRFMRVALVCAALAVPLVVFTQPAATGVSARAKQVHDAAIVVDSHDDTTQRLLSEKGFDLGTRHENGNVDIPRMRDGGLDALFFSIWVP